MEKKVTPAVAMPGTVEPEVAIPGEVEPVVAMPGTLRHQLRWKTRPIIPESQPVGKGETSDSVSKCSDSKVNTGNI